MSQIPLGQSSPLTLAAFFSEFESPSRLKAFAVDFFDLIDIVHHCCKILSKYYFLSCTVPNNQVVFAP